MPISVRYPLVEGVTGLLFLASVERFGLSVDPLDHRAERIERFVRLALSVELMADTRPRAHRNCGRAAAVP